MVSKYEIKVLKYPSQADLDNKMMRLLYSGHS